MTMTFKDLVRFVSSRPHYFDGDEGLTRIREALAEPMEAYSRLTDPETFEDIQQRTAEAAAQRRQQLEQELAAVEESLRETMAGLLRAEANHAALVNRENEHARIRRNRPVPAPPRSRVSHLWAVLLDFAGAVFLYLGILTDEGVSPNLILFGIFLIAFGFVWSARIGIGKPAPVPANAGPPDPVPIPRARFRLLEAEIALNSTECSRLEREKSRLKRLLRRTERVVAGFSPHPPSEQGHDADSLSCLSIPKR